MAGQPQIWTVGQLTRRIKNVLETSVGFVWVSGEISNYRVSPASHAYFTLKDKDCQLEAVMFRGRLMGARFGPENGLQVIVGGTITVYEKRGNYQIICEEMQPKGMGALQLAFEKLRKKLQEEGLFDETHKKPIPLLPRRIGVVTSPTGAAIRDILNVLERRYPNLHVILYPARVQGDEAAEEIVEGIRILDAWGVDVMIVGRGGGSLEDLWPFNEEIVVRAVYEATTPVIAAVGHEIDFTLTDFAADVRAPTPSAAAELVVQERDALLSTLLQLQRRLSKSMTGRIQDARHRLLHLMSSYVFQRPEHIVRDRRQQADELRMRLQTAMAERLRGYRNRLDRGARGLGLLSPANRVRRALERFTVSRQRLIQAAGGTMQRLRGQLQPMQAHLNALSPFAILSRGYAIAWKLPERAIVREADQLAPGDKIALMLGKGGATAIVETTEEGNNG